MTYAMIIASVFMMLLTFIFGSVFGRDLERSDEDDGLRPALWGIALGVLSLALSYCAGVIQ